MALRVYNTLGSQKQEFSPGSSGKVGVYVCGPTVYDMAHLGHARSCVSFDVIVRYLRRRWDVTYVRNYTDVDDKIIARAAERGAEPLALSRQFIAEFERDMAELGNAEPDIAPRVSDNIPEIISLVRGLMSTGHAYAASGDVYFAVESFADYGKLSGRRIDEMEAGARVAISEKKRHPMDFALWKAAGAGDGDASWESPWGRGRPGWHIECSAMSGKYLGETFDIHGGGKDLIFPHHENEIAQSEATSGGTYARYWLHNGFVNVDNEKMSKSLGNFRTVRELCEAFSGKVLRYYFLTTHYRSPINYTPEGLRDAEDRLKYLCETVCRLRSVLVDEPGSSRGDPQETAHSSQLREFVSRFEAAMDDDFNTAKAIASLSDAFKLANVVLDRSEDNGFSSEDLGTLRGIAAVISNLDDTLGLFDRDANAVLQCIRSSREQRGAIDTATIERLVADRNAARAARDFSRADALRDELQQLGVVLKDKGGETTWELQAGV